MIPFPSIVVKLVVRKGVKPSKQHAYNIHLSMIMNLYVYVVFTIYLQKRGDARH